jgi:hypothetical protein
MSFDISALISNPWLWVALGVMGVTGIGYKFFRKLPVVGGLFNMTTLTYVAVIGILISTGIAANIMGESESGSLTGGSSYISDLQITTAFLFDGKSNGGQVVEEDPNIDDLVHARMYTGNVSETAGIVEIETGIITVTRSGDLPADSVMVSCAPSIVNYQNDNGSNAGNTYNILEETAKGEFEVYLNDGGAATTSSSKEQTSLAFDEGVATATLGVAMEVDSDGFMALNQYNTRDVVCRIGNAAMTFRIQKLN